MASRGGGVSGTRSDIRPQSLGGELRRAGRAFFSQVWKIPGWAGRGWPGTFANLDLYLDLSKVLKEKVKRNCLSNEGGIGGEVKLGATDHKAGD